MRVGADEGPRCKEERKSGRERENAFGKRIFGNGGSGLHGAAVKDMAKQ